MNITFMNLIKIIFFWIGIIDTGIVSLAIMFYFLCKWDSKKGAS